MTVMANHSTELTKPANAIGLAVAVLLHATVFAGIYWQSTQVVPPQVASLSVRMLPAAAEVIQPQPVPKPPIPKPVVPEPKKAEVKRVKTDAPAPVKAEPKPAEPKPEPVNEVVQASAAAANESAAALNSSVVAPRFDAAYLNNPSPAYPMQSRRLNEAGRVLLRVQVSETGNALQVQLHQSSGYSRLDQAALDAVKRWRFVPARRGDIAISEWVIVPITFNLTR
ncbi:MAG: energy transducer TonB [Moraxellaceae bacterium]|nr:energy transducer TonB [Moraxellaceae bacterium]